MIYNNSNIMQTIYLIIIMVSEYVTKVNLDGKKWYELLRLMTKNINHEYGLIVGY